MDEERTVNEEMEEVLRAKINEFSDVDLNSSTAKDSAEALAKATDAFVKLEQEKRGKKEWVFKILGVLGTVAGAIGAAAVKAICDKKIAEEQIAYLDTTHQRAYAFESEGRTEHLVTSPSARDALKERPRLK